MTNFITKTKLITTIYLIVSSVILFISPAHAKKYYTTFVTDGGDLHDHSFNQSAYDGFLLAKTAYGININYLKSETKDDYLTNLNTAVEDGSDLIFGVGFLIANDIVKSAKMHPTKKFVVIDVDTSKIPLENLTGITYDVEQAGYLAGILAGYMTDKYSTNSSKLNNKKVIGAILGVNTPAIEAYVAGYIAGAKSVTNNITVLVSTVNTFTDQKKMAKETEKMINQGADIILPIAGAAGLGAMAMAKKHNTLIIGVDRDQNSDAPDTVLVSIEKDITSSVYNMIGLEVKGHALPHYLHLGIKDGGVKLSPFHSFDGIIPYAVKKELHQAEEKIIDGTLIIPTTIAQALQR